MDGPRLEIDSPGLRASLLLGEAQPIEIDLPQRPRPGAGPASGPGCRSRARSRSPGRRWEVDGAAASTTSPPATTSATPAGTGRPGSAAPPTAAPSPGTWSRAINDPPERQRAGGLGRRRAPRAGPGPLRRRRRRSTSPAATRLDFAAESEHARDENFLLIRSRYRHRFGTFSGSLDGIELAAGLGVMEEHDAVW